MPRTTLLILLATILLTGCQQEAEPRASNASIMIAAKVVAATDHLTGIQDVESATAAAAEIEQGAVSLESIVADIVPELSTPGKALVLETIAGSSADITKKFDKACEVPGVKEIIEPAVTRFRDALSGINLLTETPN